MSRKLLRRASLTIMVGILGGCGSSHEIHPAGRVVNVAEARAFVRAVGLREGDVLGWQRLAPGAQLGVSKAGISEAACAGRVDPARRILAVYSPRYGKHNPTGAVSMQSAVVVWPTAAMAARDASAGLTARAFTCYAREQTAEASLHREHVSVARLASPLRGVSEAYEWRTTGTVKFGIAPFYFTRYQDILGFVDGPAEIVLGSDSTRAPIPPATELEVLKAMYARAQKYKWS